MKNLKRIYRLILLLNSWSGSDKVLKHTDGFHTGQPCYQPGPLDQQRPEPEFKNALVGIPFVTGIRLRSFQW